MGLWTNHIISWLTLWHVHRSNMLERMPGPVARNSLSSRALRRPRPWSFASTCRIEEPESHEDHSCERGQQPLIYAELTEPLWLRGLLGPSLAPSQVWLASAFVRDDTGRSLPSCNISSSPAWALAGPGYQEYHSQIARGSRKVHEYAQ